MPQIFISYKSEDGSWAERVADTLESFGVNVWRDHAAESGIRVGYKWDDEIKAAIGESTTMVVLWSNKLHSDATSVAHREMQWMEQVIDKDKTRRFITLLLDNAQIDRSPILGAYQAETSLKDLYASAGPDGAWSISDPEWYSAMLRVLDLFEVRDVVEVRYVIGAMTRQQAAQMVENPAKWAQDENAWQAFQAVRKMTAAFDPDLYGDRPDLWTPFSYIPGLEKVAMGEVISQYDRARREYVRNSNKTPNWVLVSYSDGLLSEDPQARKAAREALKSKCLIVLDPVSLLHKTIYQNLVTSWGLQARENAFVIGLSACEYLLHTDFRNTIPPMAQAFRNLLDTTYDRFGQSFEPDDHCVLDVGNHDQFARWLQVAGDGIIAAAKSPLRFGSMSPAFRNRIRSITPAAPGSSLVMMGGRSVKP
jgi:hypothetical protein